MNYNVIGIDPGTKESAVVIYRPKSTEPIIYNGILENDVMVEFIRQYKSSYDQFELESLFAIENVVTMGGGNKAKAANSTSPGSAIGASTLETMYWVGRFSEAWLSRFKKTYYTRVRRVEVIINMTGVMQRRSNKTKDTEIREKLISRFGQQGTKKNPGPLYSIANDEWSALAIAVTAWDQRIKYYTELFTTATGGKPR